MHLTLNLSQARAAELLPRLLLEYVGGEEAVEMLWDHHIERMTFDQLALKYDMPRASIHRRILKARVRLRRVGIMPDAWERSTEPAHAGTHPDAA